MVGELHELFHAVEEHEVVERERVAFRNEASRHFHDVPVDLHALEDLQDHAMRRKGPAQTRSEEGVRHVHERAVLANEVVEADVAERRQQHLRSRRSASPSCTSASDIGPEQELVRDVAEPRVVDGLPRHHGRRVSGAVRVRVFNR